MSCMPRPASACRTSVVIVVTVEDDAVGALRRPTLSAQRAWICHLIEAAKTGPSFFFGITKANQNTMHYRRVAQCTRRLGWSGPGPVRIRGHVVTGYRRSV